MTKIAIVTDSNSGIRQNEVINENIFVLPMPFTINGKVYFEDINLTQEEFFEYQTNGAEIFTSQPVVGDIKKLWDDILKEYDQIIHIPMSSGLSGSCQTAMMLSSEYNNKVVVIDNQRISVTLKHDVYLAQKLVKEGKSALEIKEILEKYKLDAGIYLIVPTLEYLKKGGRITAAAALLGSMLKIKPILQIKGEKLDAFAKSRTMSKAIKIIKDAALEESKQLSGEFYVDIAYSRSKEPALQLKEELKELFPNHNIECSQLSLSVACHVGPDILAIAVSKKID